MKSIPPRPKCGGAQSLAFRRKTGAGGADFPKVNRQQEEFRNAGFFKNAGFPERGFSKNRQFAQKPKTCNGAAVLPKTRAFAKAQFSQNARLFRKMRA